MLTNTQSTPHQPYRVSLIDIKNILSLLPNQINMRTLTVAIRQHCLQAQQTHFKDYFLRFFLQCQCKLKKSNNVEWNRVINNQLKKIVGVQNICQFLNKKLLNSALAKIQTLSFMGEPTIEDKINEQFSELKDMDISEEVRIKTKYFFKWFQFLQEKREIKVLKSRQIENLKKAKVFSQYSVKRLQFFRWKQHVHKTRLIKQKGLALEEKTKMKQLVSIFSQIKQKIQIINIQKMLEEAVVKKMEGVQVKNFYKKLNFGFQRSIEITASLRKKNNIWLYRFYSYLIRDSFPLMNKTSVIARRDREAEFQHICLLNSWKGLKNLVKRTSDKIKSIRFFLKKGYIKQFLQIKKQMTSIKHKKQQSRLSLKKNQLHLLLKMARFQQQKTIFFRGLQTQVQNYLITQSFRGFFRQLSRLRAVRKDLKDKTINLYTSSIQRSKKQLVSNLNDFKKKKQNIIKFCRRVQSTFLLNGLRRGINQYRNWKEGWCGLKQDMSQRYMAKLMHKGWKGLKQTKKIKAGEYEACTSLTQILESKILSDVFCFLKNRNQQSKKIQTLFIKTEVVVKKIAFITILNRMLSKKMKVKSFAAKQQVKLKRKLFDWLLSYQDHMALSSSKVHFIYSRIMKRQLLNHLREGLAEKYSLEKSNYLFQLRSKAQVLVKLKGSLIQRRQFEQSTQVVEVAFKKRRFQEFRSITRQLSELREDQDQKSLKIAKKVVKNYLKTFKLNVKRNKNTRVTQVENETHKEQIVSKIKKMIAVSALKSMLRQSDIALSKKYTTLRLNNLRGIFTMLKLNINSAQLKIIMKHSKAQEIIQSLQQNKIMKEKKQLLSNQLNKHRLSNSFTIIDLNIKLENQQLEQKSNHVREYIQEQRVKRWKQTFVSKIKGHYELKQNTMILMNSRVRQSCREMIRLYLKYKSRTIKEFISLRHYATNVKRRAMRALKCTVNVSVLKENKNKMENHSKMVMQKSIDNARKKSKLIETIERYNLSRVSRVIR